MRVSEGKSLALVLEKHLKIVQNHLQEIEKRAGKSEGKYRQKILDKLQEFKLSVKRTKIESLERLSSTQRKWISLRKSQDSSLISSSFLPCLFQMSSAWEGPWIF